MNIHRLQQFIEEKRVITTSEIADRFKVSWNTAEKHLLELALDQKISRIKKSGVNLWVWGSLSAQAHRSSNKYLNFVDKVRVVTTSELAEHFSISWNTAEKHLLELALEGKLERLKKSGVNLWVLR